MHERDYLEQAIAALTEEVERRPTSRCARMCETSVWCDGGLHRHVRDAQSRISALR